MGQSNSICLLFDSLCMLGSDSLSKVIEFLQLQ